MSNNSFPLASVIATTCSPINHDSSNSMDQTHLEEGFLSKEY